jgi:hypothetical protein
VLALHEGAPTLLARAAGQGDAQALVGAEQVRTQEVLDGAADDLVARAGAHPGIERGRGPHHAEVHVEQEQHATQRRERRLQRRPARLAAVELDHGSTHARARVRFKAGARPAWAP